MIKLTMMSRLLLIALFALAKLSAQDVFTGVQRIVAVGDIHGGFTEFVTILRQAGVIDTNNKWIGGATHLVQLGDVLDRGADSRKALDLLASLESPAKKAKGRVHSLLGNHEVMNMLGDLRYVAPGEFAAFATPGSAELRNQAYDTLADQARKADAAYRNQWELEHPLGWVEHRQAFAPDGRYGKTFLQRKAIVKINDTLFLHAGISAKFAAMSIEEINQNTRKELKELIATGFLMDQDSPFWYRGMATDPEETLTPMVETVLKNFDVKRIVLGHTPTTGAIMPRFNGRVILADVGLAGVYNGSLVSLVIEDGKAFALHRGTKLAIPSSPDALFGYLKAAAALDPAGTKFRNYVESLGQR